MMNYYYKVIGLAAVILWHLGSNAVVPSGPLTWQVLATYPTRDICEDRRAKLLRVHPGERVVCLDDGYVPQQ